MKKIICFSFLFMLFACKNVSVKKPNTESNKGIDNTSKKEYPAIVDSFGVQHWYDETKWRLYCIHCDDTLRFHASAHINDTVTFGMLPLIFDNITLTKDTLEIDFDFMYKDKNLLEHDLIENSTDWGCVYDLAGDSLIFYSGYTNGRYSLHKCLVPGHCPDRHVKPLQPEVIKYINDNKRKIDSWFYKEAIKKGVLKE